MTRREDLLKLREIIDSMLSEDKESVKKTPKLKWGGLHKSGDWEHYYVELGEPHWQLHVFNPSGKNCYSATIGGYFGFAINITLWQGRFYPSLDDALVYAEESAVLKIRDTINNLEAFLNAIQMQSK